MLKKRIKWAHPLQGRRIKEVIAEVFDVWERDVWQNNSPWENQVGGCTWGVSNSTLSTTAGFNGNYYDLHCFGTMKDCLKYGFTVDHDNHEIHANEHPQICDKCLKEKSCVDMSYNHKGICLECTGEPKLNQEKQ